MSAGKARFFLQAKWTGARSKMSRQQQTFLGNGPEMKVSIGKLELKNPVMLASGTCGYGPELADVLDLTNIGAIVVKGISMEPRAGNPPPRIAETPCGLLNAIGLENVGVEAFISSKLPWLYERNITTIVNILGNSVGEYQALAARLNKCPGIHALEVNISCPNVKEGGVAFGTDPEQAAKVAGAVVQACDLPVIVKLSPNVSDICSIARAVEDAGASAVSLINTILGMAIDIQKKTPVLGNVFGGLSGPAIKPVALRMVWQAARCVDIPVIGVGGITSASDALEFFMAGACAVQVGTATLVDPGAAGRVLQGIVDFMQENHYQSLKELRIGP